MAICSIHAKTPTKRSCFIGVLYNIVRVLVHLKPNPNLQALKP